MQIINANTKPTLANAMREMGQHNDMREYQQLKTADEMERDAVRRTFESLKRKHGDNTARKIMAQKGYNMRLLP